MKWLTPLVRTAAVASVLVFAACGSESTTEPEEFDGIAVETALMTTEAEAGLYNMIESVNAALAESGQAYRVGMVEYLSGDAMGGTVIAKDVGNKQLGFDFVADDTRREWDVFTTGSPNNLTYALDRTSDAAPPLGGVSGADSNAAIDRAMATWSQQQCSDMTITAAPDYGVDLGVIAFLFGLGGSPFTVADLHHTGYTDIDFAGGVLGATFTFGFTDVNGNFTDINGDGRFDTAFREIYYDPSWTWADDGSSNFDIETVALHEAGHGLSRAHFGTVRIKNDGQLQASPRAVMNALYGGPLRDLLGPDNGGHCSDWGNWPNGSPRR